jgi:Ferritin-like
VIRVHPKVSGLLSRGDVHGLREALQAALELEHAVIPPYLYALYSLDPAGNRTVAEIIRSVVDEEMLHLTLAANLLNAVGGRPVLDSPDILPRYPGPLPGTVDDGLVVGLAPFSIALVQDVFMIIEQPELPEDYGGGSAAGPDPAGAALPSGPPVLPGAADRAGSADSGPTGEPLTIGQFYRQIRTTLVALGEDAFTGRRHHQVTTNLLPGAIPVTGVASACRAIDTIIDQGEGTLTTPLEVVGGDLAHYYRFAEIVRGRRLIRFPDPPGRHWAYLGDPVTVNPAGIRPVPVNPTLAGYPADSAAGHACKSFNYSYTSLLKVLHSTFNGTPGELMPAISLMGSLQQQAVDMTAGTTTNGVPAGPSFEWQPTG